ncbi:MAG: hypothetical protein M1814_002363 [Vezdaea aestivalis]|nr:MAG: hypothetical protein M1814_002363 [Vezdaea aestivalis]
MASVLEIFKHRQACQTKQQEREARATAVAEAHGPFNDTDRSILDLPIEELTNNVRNGSLKPAQVVRSYGRAAIAVHKKTNCLTEIMLPEAEKWVESDVNLEGPLAGLPISLKDSVVVAGFDASTGYSRYTGKAHFQDGSMVRWLKHCGAVPYVKTNLPITLLSFESTSSLWGRATNPYNRRYSPGGSTGGESALLASFGGRIGIGSDVAGSVRVPAHNSGIYSLRCSTGRFPKFGMTTSMAGQEGVPSVFSPMARTLPDLTYFTRSVLSTQPWTFDHSVHPLPWRADAFQLRPTPLCIGILSTDSVVRPSPACSRALRTTVAALTSAGHILIPLTPPSGPHSPFSALRIGAALLLSDGCATFLRPFRAGEWNDPGAAQMALWTRLPSALRWAYCLYVRYVRRDPIWADLLEAVHTQTTAEQWALVARREELRGVWHAWRQEAGVDFLICPVNATPALPHGSMKGACASCGYTFLWNVLDWTAGVLPVLKVQRGDRVEEGWSPGNGIEKGAYEGYDPVEMEGLPVGVQVVGGRLEEERILQAMRVVREALDESGCNWEGLDFRDA